MSLKVIEIFYSIQGEGFHSGEPMVFVRTAGCNMACAFCDTDFTVRRRLSAREIAAEVLRLSPVDCNVRRVCITGGEPTIHDLDELLRLLDDAGMVVHMESNGSGPRPGRVGWFTVSPKRMDDLVVDSCDELKVVLGAVDPEEAAQRVFSRVRYIQPMSEDFAPALEWVLGHPWWRLSIQAHKVVGAR